MAGNSLNKTWDEFEAFLGKLRKIEKKGRGEKKDAHFSSANMGKKFYPDLLSLKGELQWKQEILVEGKPVGEFFKDKDEFICQSAGTVHREQLSVNEMEMVQSEYEKLAEIHIQPKGPFSLLRPLFEERHYEADIRTFLDALLNPIILKNNLVIKREQPLQDDQDLKPDYTIYGKDTAKKSIPLGVVEAKNAGWIVKDSVTQCMQQLQAIHAMEEKQTGQNGPLFGIVTDALHFIFIILNADGMFEFQSDKTEKLKFYTANTWKDLGDIAAMINGFCQTRTRGSDEGTTADEIDAKRRKVHALETEITTETRDTQI